MKRENLPIYFNLPIDATLASFSKNYNDIICLNTTTIISSYNIFQKVEPFNTSSNILDIVKDSLDYSNTEVEAAINEIIDKPQLPVNDKTDTLTSNEISKEKSNVIETNQEVRKTYELYEKMFNEGTFGKSSVPDAPVANVDSTEIIKPKENITELSEKSEARQTFEMYEKMFAEGTFEEKQKTEEPTKTNEPVTEKSEARQTFEMYEKMFAEGTFEEKQKTEEPTKVNEPVTEKSEARQTFEMYEKMFAEGTFEEKQKTEEPTKTSEPVTEKSEARQTFEMYEKMFAEGTFEEKQKTEEPTKVDEPVTEKSEARQTFEMYEKMFAEGTFEEKQKTEEPIKTSEPVPNVQNIFEAIPNPLENITEAKQIFEKPEIKETFELYENTAVKSLDEKVKNIEISNETGLVDKDNFFAIYNLDHKSEDSTFFLKFDETNSNLVEYLEEHQNNIFKLKKIDNNNYHFEVLENNVNHLFYINNKELVITFCDILNTKHDGHTRFKSIRTGKIVKEDNKWVIKDKAKTMYQ